MFLRHGCDQAALKATGSGTTRMEAGINCHTFSARSVHASVGAAFRGGSAGVTCIACIAFMRYIIGQTVARKHT